MNKRDCLKMKCKNKSKIKTRENAHKQDIRLSHAMFFSSSFNNFTQQTAVPYITYVDIKLYHTKN